MQAVLKHCMSVASKEETNKVDPAANRDVHDYSGVCVL
jgi:hypothetical protein